MQCVVKVHLMALLFISFYGTCKVDCSCTSGFMELDLLNKRAEKSLSRESSDTFLDGEFRLMSNAAFNCNGTITGFVIGGSASWNRTKYPEIQIWRNTGGNTYTRQGQSQEIKIAEGYFSPDGVLYYNLPTPMSFQSGDVLGIYQPPEKESAVTIFYDPSTTYQTSSRPNSRVINLHSMEATDNEQILISPVSDSSCTNEFLTPSELRQKTLNLNINDMQRKQRQQIIFPNMTFTCNGSITKLIAVVDVLEEKGVPLMAPEVQIWRKSRNESKDSYAKIKSTFINTTQVFNRNVVELNLQDPIKVQEGDILGVYQPRYNESTLSIRYQIRDGPINYVIEQQDSALSSFSQVESSIPSYDYPLVSMEIKSDFEIHPTHLSPTLQTTAISTVNSLSTTVLRPTQSETPGAINAVDIALITVASVLACVIFTIMMILLIVVIRHIKRKNCLSKSHRAAVSTSASNDQLHTRYSITPIAASFNENDNQRDYEPVYDYAKVGSMSKREANTENMIVPMHQNIAYSQSAPTRLKNELHYDTPSVQQLEDHHPLEGSIVYSYAGVGLRKTVFT